MPQSYIYGSLGSPYLGAAATQSPSAAQAAANGLMQMPAATQLSHAAALAAATSQFYEYQVRINQRIVQVVMEFNFSNTMFCNHLIKVNFRIPIDRISFILFS